MKRKLDIPKKTIVKLLISSVCIIVFVAVLFSVPSITIRRDHGQANVLLFSKGDDTSLTTSLQIDTEAINLTIITQSNIDSNFNEDLLAYTDVIIIDRFMPSKISDLHILRAYINGTNSSIGLIFFGGLKNDLTKPDDFSDEQINMISPLLPATISPSYQVSPDDTSDASHKIQISMNKNIENQVLTDREHSNILVRHIAWTSSPLISKRMLIRSIDMNPSAIKIIESIDEAYSIISEWTLSNNGGTVILFSMLITEYNNPFVLWPYFNYLMYVSVFHVKSDFSDNNIESFAEWPYSPIPHLIEIIMWFSMIGVLWVITFYWFFKFKNKKITDRETEVPLTQKEIK